MDIVSLFIIRTKLDFLHSCGVSKVNSPVVSEQSYWFPSKSRCCPLNNRWSRYCLLSFKRIQHVNKLRLVTCQEPESNHCRRIMGIAFPLGPWECSRSSLVHCAWSDYDYQTTVWQKMHTHYFFFRISSWQRKQEHEFLFSIALYPVSGCHFIFLFQTHSLSLIRDISTTSDLFSFSFGADL